MGLVGSIHCFSIGRGLCFHALCSLRCRFVAGLVDVGCLVRLSQLLAQPVKLLAAGDGIDNDVLPADDDRWRRIGGPDRRWTKVRGGLQSEAACNWSATSKSRMVRKESWSVAAVAQWSAGKRCQRRPCRLASRAIEIAVAALHQPGKGICAISGIHWSRRTERIQSGQRPIGADFEHGAMIGVQRALRRLPPCHRNSRRCPAPTRLGEPRHHCRR